MAKIIVWADGGWEWEHSLTASEYNQLVFNEYSLESFEEDDPLLPDHIRKEITCGKIHKQFHSCVNTIFTREQ